MVTRAEGCKFYDIRKNPVREIAGVWLEEGKGKDVLDRINLADPIISRGGVPEMDFPEYNKHRRAEEIATRNACELAEGGYDLIFWISPADEGTANGGVYDEGRFNILLAETAGDAKILRGRGIPLLLNRFESVDLAERLMANGGITMDPAYGVEGVRKQPIAFKIDDLEKWIDKCRELMPEYEAWWQFFENQGEVKNKEKMMRVVETAMVAARGDNRLFEMLMASMGHLINPAGAHGGSWLGEGRGLSIFTLQSTNGLVRLGIEKRADGKYICPCGQELKEGTRVCPKCGLKISLN
ncbi:MAG: hypothetical protein WC686_00775 [Candidatus Shapirobacteria bacterium]|jgi:hypothetical protein